MRRAVVPSRLSAPAAFGWAVGAVVPLVVGLAYYAGRMPGVDTVPLQLAGAAEPAARVVGHRRGDFHRALYSAVVLLSCFLATLLLALRLGRHTFASRRGRRLARWAAAASLLGAGCGLAATCLLIRSVDAAETGDLPWAVATGLSTAMWLLLTASSLVAAVMWTTTVFRAGRFMLHDPWHRAWNAVAAAVRRLTRAPAATQGESTGRAPAGHTHPHTADLPAVVPPRPVIRADGSWWPLTVAAVPADGEVAGRGDVRDLGDAAGPPAHWRHASRQAPGRTRAELGFCVSGGGIRSACVTLGALQSLRHSLLRARYLVSVSGGGYTVGAMQLALAGRRMEPPAGAPFPDGAPHPDGRRRGGAPATAFGTSGQDGDDPAREASEAREVRKPRKARGAGDGRSAASGASVTPENVLGPGSPEEDHLRRHSKYVADGAAEWTVALGVLLRGLLASLFLLAATTATIGLGLSWAYHHVPVTDLSHLVGRPGVQFCTTCTPPRRPEFRAAAGWAVVAALAMAVATWLLWLVAYAWWRVDALGTAVARVFQGLVVLGVALAGVVFVVPLLAWGAVWAQTSLHVNRPKATVVAGGTAFLTYVAALISTLWRRRQTVRGGLQKVLDTVRGRPGLARAVPNGLVQYAVVWLVLAVLALAFLFTLGFTTGTGWDWPVWAQAGIPGMLLFIGVSLDQTWMGLHPFYRRRLAAAFAVRRVTGDHGVQVAAPYEFTTEVTRLSRYGAPPDGFPQVIFAAAANLSGSDRTPPGRRAVSFTLSHDYVGGPDVGYACTACLEQRARRHIARDLTVESAIAVSGAAFSSAMGAQARAFQTLFALSNARLGTWLPNPGALAELWKDGKGTRDGKGAEDARDARDDKDGKGAADGGDGGGEDGAGRRWERPELPVLRRLPYLLREVFGRYPMDGRLLLVTDGGHYENLGLVELLRQGVRTAVCIDASGDTPPFATTLAQAIALAREELGITITLHEPTAFAPGSAEPLKPESTLSALNSRLSRTAVVTGDILYPSALAVDGEPPSRHGTLIVARTTLTADLPYHLLSYAAAHPVFPHDSTSDQWFDHQQFDAYQALGRYIGAKVQHLLDLGAAGPARRAAPAAHE